MSKKADPDTTEKLLKQVEAWLEKNPNPKRIGDHNVHPALVAARMPLMPWQRIVELAASIALRGQLVDAETQEGMLVDGRNRAIACWVAGVHLRTKRYDGRGGTLAEFIYALAAERRDLTPTQRLLLAKDLLPQFKAEAAARQVAAGARGVEGGRGNKKPLAPAGAKGSGKKAAEAAAKAAGASTRQLERVVRVVTAAPELEQDLRDGKITPGAAERKLALDAARAAAAKHRPPEGRYSVILADPPWQFDVRVDDESHRGRVPYTTMSTDDICAMSVPADDSCVLFLWSTKQHLLDGSARRVAEAWGFTVRNYWTWEKIDKAGDVRIGPGNWGRNADEPLLICTRGKVCPDFASQPTVIRAERGEHSEKPAVFYEIIERCVPSKARLEMFARGGERPGWTITGSQLGTLKGAA